MIEYDLCLQYYYANWGITLLFAVLLFITMMLSYYQEIKLRNMHRFLIVMNLMNEYYKWKEEREK